jgi:hypothetical protein
MLNKPHLLLVKRLEVAITVGEQGLASDGEALNTAILQHNSRDPAKD